MATTLNAEVRSVRGAAAARVLCFLVCYAGPAPDSAEVAQLVEHVTENHGVASSILALGTTFYTDKH